MEREGKVRVIIGDDHPMLLRGLADMISDDPAFQVVATCTDGVEVLDAIRRLQPDIALVDFKMPKSNGLQVARQAGLDCTGTKIIVLTAFMGDGEIMEAVSSGVAGILSKTDGSDTFMACVREVAGGRTWLPDHSVGRAVRREEMRRRRGQEIAAQLTERERQVSVLAIGRSSNKTISRELNIAEGTVKIHLNNVFNKLGVFSRAELNDKIAAFVDQLAP